MSSAYILSPSTRTRRAGAWAAGKAVTFIVTLAATRTVTLAARAAGMSRKSAYALRERDPAFAAAWDAALGARQGNKVDEVEDPPVSFGWGDSRPRTPPALDALHRDRYFARLAAIRDAAPNLAPTPPLP